MIEYFQANYISLLAAFVIGSLSMYLYILTYTKLKNNKRRYVKLLENYDKMKRAPIFRKYFEFTKIVTDINFSNFSLTDKIGQVEIHIDFIFHPTYRDTRYYMKLDFRDWARKNNFCGGTFILFTQKFYAKVANFLSPPKFNDQQAMQRINESDRIVNGIINFAEMTASQVIEMITLLEKILTSFQTEVAIFRDDSKLEFYEDIPDVVCASKMIAEEIQEAMYKLAPNKS